MIKPQIPANEAERIQELLSLEILDTESEPAFNDAVALASYITGCPISLISLIDSDRQWFKAKVGLEATETPRDISFCGHAINNDALFEVPDAVQDERFHDNPLVTGDLGIRFYAGQPITTSQGFRIGTLCTIDRESRNLSEEQRRHLTAIAKQVAMLIELRLINRHQKLKALTQTQFLANVSHEVRTPLTSILGNVSMAQSELAPDSKMNQYLQTIERNSKYALSVLQNVMDASRLELGQAKLESIAFESKELQEHVIAMFGVQAEKKNLSLNVSLSPRVPKLISTDRTRVQQVVSNLVSNSMKFTETGRIDVDINYLNDQLKMTVGDTGIGLNDMQAAGIFQPFVQADSTIQAKYGGTGLGLAISKQICEALGGSLNLAQSEPGKGSQFVALFRAPEAQEETKPAEKDFAAITRTLHSIGSMALILVVDDNSIMRQTFKHYLKRYSMPVDEAEGGNEALEKIARTEYDVIFLDVEMPGMNGIDVLKRIRTLRKRPKVVAFTAHASPEYQEKFLAAGFDAVLTKPFAAESIASALFDHLVN